MVLTFTDFLPSTALATSTEAETIKHLSHNANQDHRILDIGCGRGNFANQLAGLGYDVLGIEPQAREKTRLTSNGAQIYKAGAEEIPFDDERQFDVVMFGHSFHHVPANLMDKALDEALRVLKTGGLLIVTEPLAEGNFYEVVKPVDDEAPLYELVKNRLSQLVSNNIATHTSRTYVFSEPSYRTVGHLKSILVKVDPDRAKAPTAAWEDFNRRFIAQPKSWFFGKRSLKSYSRIDFFTKS